MKKFIWIAVGVLLGLGGAITGVLYAQSKALRLNPLQSIQLFEQVLTNVEGGYQRKVDTYQLIKAAIDGMLSSLDPYSEFMEPEDASDLRVRIQGEFGGIGINIGSLEGQLTVMRAIPGTPAHKLGIMAGDIFLDIEGKSTEGMTVRDAVNILRGTPGTKVTVKMGREGVEDTLTYSITREVIKIHAVPYAGKVSEDVGYIHLADFSQTARTELEAAIESLLTKEHVKKLIFDLRGNGGGLLQEGFEVSNLFLPPGKVIVKTTGQTPQSKRSFVSNHPNPILDRPLVILVDRGTASASEIATGALQDWERALVVGETTFGKGTVQTPMPMPQSSSLKLTTALWLTPSGRCVDIRVTRDTTAQVQDSIFYTLGENHRLTRGWKAIAPEVYVPYPRLQGLATRIRSDWYFDFAVKYTNKHPGLEQGFDVTPEMLGEFRTFLRGKEIEKGKKLEFTDAGFDSVQSLVERSLKIQIAGKLWGTAGEYEARMPYDEQVQKSLELLAGATTPQNLFSALPKEEEE